MSANQADESEGWSDSGRNATGRAAAVQALSSRRSRQRPRRIRAGAL